MAETARPFSRDLSPRGVVQQALQGIHAENMPALEHCLQCRSCSSVCPAGVDVAGLIADLRQTLPEWKAVNCALCGAPMRPMTADQYLQKAVGADFEEALSYPSLCPACKRRAYIRNNS